MSAQTDNQIEVAIVCAWCDKHMRTEYVSQKMLANVSHGICNTCKTHVLEQFHAEMTRNDCSDTGAEQ